MNNLFKNAVANQFAPRPVLPTTGMTPGDIRLQLRLNRQAAAMLFREQLATNALRIRSNRQTANTYRLAGYGNYAEAKPRFDNAVKKQTDSMFNTAAYNPRYNGTVGNIDTIPTPDVQYSPALPVAPQIKYGSYISKKAAAGNNGGVVKYDPLAMVNSLIEPMNQYAALDPIQGVDWGTRLINILQGTNPHGDAIKAFDARLPLYSNLLKSHAALLNEHIPQQVRDEMADIMNSPGNYNSALLRVENRFADDFKNSRLASLVDRGGRHFVRGGLGVLSDALFTDHKGDYGVMDNLTAAAGGDLVGLVGRALAHKLSNGNETALLVGNVVGSTIGGPLLNSTRRALFA